MTDKELRRLKRKELTEIVLSQEREISELKEELVFVSKKKPKKEIRGYTGIGSLAESALNISGMLKEAQSEADRYLAEIGDLEAGTQAECDGIIRRAEEESRRITETTGQQYEQKMNTLKEYVDYINGLVSRMYSENPELRYQTTNQQPGAKKQVPAQRNQRTDDDEEDNRFIL